MSGIAVNALGHAHPAIVKTVSSQAASLIHLGNYYHHKHAANLATQLLLPLAKREGNHRWGYECSADKHGRVFFANSGTEANEAAIKFCRKWGKSLDPSGAKSEFVSFFGAFHGRTLGALSATPTPKYQEPFQPLVPGFRYGHFNDVAGAAKLVNKNTCGILVEPIQGEGGVNVASEEFLLQLRKLADKFNCLLVYDEIQVSCQIRCTPALAGKTSRYATALRFIFNSLLLASSCWI